MCQFRSREVPATGYPTCNWTKCPDIEQGIIRSGNALIPLRYYIENLDGDDHEGKDEREKEQDGVPKIERLPSLATPARQSLVEFLHSTPPTILYNQGRFGSGIPLQDRRMRCPSRGEEDFGGVEVEV